jgi:micrococcal nuclease
VAASGPVQTSLPKLPPKDWTGTKAHKVVRIVDGDTVVVSLNGKPTRVRLIGVDTPETVHPKKAVEFYGKEASRFTTNLLKGESVYLDYDQQKTDKYGRTLAYLYRAPDGLFVNLEIIRQGYGHAYTMFPFKYMEVFRAYEQRAREAGRGLWAAAEGITGRNTPAPKKGVGLTVYVTKSGTKYHVAGCTHLRKSMIPITLDEARRKYCPCSVCNPPK